MWDYAEQVEETSERAVDFAEASLMRNIQEGKETSIIFYLKTKGRKRGYIEHRTHEVDHTSGGQPIVPLDYSQMSTEALEELTKLYDDSKPNKED